ncbi:cAMP-dependent protein kinase inhibitor beta isoform X1 [Canis lupus familiaris]|uniref:cAMP-dependent protein kinase inhibitor beta isoform X1 n=1 Tax=Canis lupus familiaris TaxID=9615 RepID=UPI0015F1A976|nr:cAMP-dependent protein kinase inhibitor beta isoform X1 [Canis lupus familiaris]XP_038404164.1 cAMP-dependent protein kinase inhibitor beta isoform X1 [Canis lupus familiaris]XP_038510713.1 cAMP-dependent protein kinase inhibitor beta isoform X1 [Canis lupus familiaris]XP_048971038.1 cAMP-dependent protein kinase inhibitor beta isoform X1 [Canis lupus dingo]
MDVHLDTPEGQESASNSGKGSSGTGNQQGHYPCMNNNNWDAMLNSLLDVAMRTDRSEMTDVESVVNNFASSARTGRRNAVPDIQGSAGTGGSSELPLSLEALSVKEDVKVDFRMGVEIYSCCQ